MKVDIKTVTLLRQITELDLNSCLNALKQSDNNIEKAIGYLKDNNQITQENYDAIMSQRQSQSQSVVTCPKCGSTSIQLVKRGWKITSGFIGSSEMINTCQNCGYQWNPKK